MEKNIDDDDLLNEEEIISMSNFNEEKQDEEDIEETFPISSQDALLAIGKRIETVKKRQKEIKK
ncbi:12919_t:CDS:2 [Entrophospora sp. SA101]|nr:12919_t:CDS:2 [Entrophospora sp. SA101]